MVLIGLEFGVVMVFLVGSGEFFGGLVILLGLLICFVVLVFFVIMLVVIFSVYFSYGLFLSNGGYEFGLVLLVGFVLLLILGVGCLSFDNLLLKCLV